MFRISYRCALSAGLAFALLSPVTAAGSHPADGNDRAPPNLFDSIAIEVSKTPYDRKWRHAWAGGGGPVAKRRHDGTQSGAFAQLAIVQRDVNRRVSYRADLPARDLGDSWSRAGSTLARGSGDCEDYAIAKGQELLTHGFQPQDIYLVIGRKPDLTVIHAILIVRAKGRFWVLDNLSADVIDADQFRNFDPIIALSTDRKWIYGFDKGARARFAARERRRPIDSSSGKLAAVVLARQAITLAMPIPH